MKKVLILAYDFPPYVSVGGLRPYSWYKYLHEFGVYPVVVTRQWSNKFGSNLDYISASETSDIKVEESERGTIIRTPYNPNLANRLYLKYGESKYKFLRKIISAYYEFAQFLFPTGPKSRLFFAAKEYLKNNQVDFIIASGDPFVLFSYSSRLSKKFGIPWIADYRDPWTQNISNQKKVFLKLITSFLEKRILKNTRAIITVSNFVEGKISTLIKNKEFFILPNGFDPEAVQNVKEIKQQSECMSIAFVGTIYNWHPFESFLKACNNFITNLSECRFRINFYGVNISKEILYLVEKKYSKLAAHLHIYPKISNDKLLEKIAADNVCLLFNDYSIVGTKIYDYIGIKRKIILCYDDDADANVLKEKYFGANVSDSAFQNLQAEQLTETNSGIVVKDAAHLEQVLMILWNEFNTHGFVACDSCDTEKYSRKIQVKKLSEIFMALSVDRQKVYQQCNRCVMDTSDAEITFDKDGYCNHCTDYFEITSKRIYQGATSDLKLTKLVEKIKRSGRDHDYDCVIGISGGVDSLYTAFIAKKMGLRVLCVHMDNGWNSELATHNIEKILKKLAMELFTVVLDWEEFRDLQLSFLKASVPEAETPTDIAIPAVLHKVAAKYKIKYILSGGNFATEGILPKSWHYNAKDVKYLKAVHKKFGTKKLRSFPTFGFQKEMYYKYLKGIRMVYPLNYLPYNKKEAIKILEQQLGWENYGGKHHESLYTKFIQSYLLYAKFGIDYRRATYSTQICAGEMTREEALQELSNKPYVPVKVEDEKEYISKKLNISLEELEKIITLPPKFFKDYPNNQKKLEFIYSVYKRLNKNN